MYQRFFSIITAAFDLHVVSCTLSFYFPLAQKTSNEEYLQAGI